MEAAIANLGGERRRARRSSDIEEHGIIAARVKPGRDVLVINISTDGVLLETLHRLLPGTIVDLQLDRSARRIVIRGRVIRCSVVAVHASALVYRGAIAFERSAAWVGDSGLDGNEVPNDPEVFHVGGRAAATHGPVSE